VATHAWYAIAQWIQETTDDALKVEEGSLYPALHRLENKGSSSRNGDVRE
jgi:DNA-binding PadR family transcriptional regulator